MKKAVEELTPEDRAELAEQLQKSPAWQMLLKPHLAELAKSARDACCSRSLSPEKRAEHIEAANILPDLVDFPEKILATVVDKKRK